MKKKLLSSETICSDHPIRYRDSSFTCLNSSGESTTTEFTSAWNIIFYILSKQRRTKGKSEFISTTINIVIFTF